MAERMTERRACERFVMPGATVYYKVEGFLSSGKYTEDYFPVADISRGGLRFLHHGLLKVDAKVTLKIIIPGDNVPLVLRGMICWISPNPERSYKYQVGVKFLPYSEKQGDNSTGDLLRLRTLEERFPRAGTER
jgi:hypothetical protein